MLKGKCSYDELFQITACKIASTIGLSMLKSLPQMHFGRIKSRAGNGAMDHG